MRKKTWIEPGLIVFVRNNPEEALLSGCKTLSGPGGAISRFNICGKVEVTADPACNSCSLLASS